MNSTKRHENYRTFGKMTFTEADEELRRYWQSRTPQERMEALEDLRIAVCGEAAINARIAPVFGALEPQRH